MNRHSHSAFLFLYVQRVLILGIVPWLSELCEYLMALRPFCGLRGLCATVRLYVDGGVPSLLSLQFSSFLGVVRGVVALCVSGPYRVFEPIIFPWCVGTAWPRRLCVRVGAVCHPMVTPTPLSGLCQIQTIYMASPGRRNLEANRGFACICYHFLALYVTEQGQEQPRRTVM